MMRPTLLIVDAVDDGRDRDDVDASFVQVVDGLQLDIKQVPTLRCELAALPMPSNWR